MALFTVQRYLGEEDDKQKPGASDILKQIQEKAKAKKKSLGNDSKFKDSPNVNIKDIDAVQSKEDLKKKDKGKKHKNKTDDVNATQDGIKVEDVEQVEEHRSTRKRKHKADSLIGEVDDDVKIEDDSFEVVKKKKKKKRRNSVENCASNESVISEAFVNESLEEDLLENSGIESEKKKLKKRKKHKRSEHLESDVHIKTESNENELKTELNSDMSLSEQEISDDETKVEDDNKDNTEDNHKGGSKGKETEIGGFTVIRDVRPSKPKKVHRVLPEWLSMPNIIASDLSSDCLPVTDMPGLETGLVDRLKDNGITHFFPVQRQVIPTLLETSLTGFHIGRAGYRPSDLCVSAPTGSGKTLAFVLPIIQALKSRVTREVRALTVLPVRDLALQVYNVFKTYCEGTDLKVGIVIGQRTLLAEQESLVKKRLRGYESLVDIVVATPGRLVDHINHTEGFNLGQLRYLVIDEADRMMGEIKQDWLLQVETAIYRSRSHPGTLTASSCRNMDTPLQKLLYSATLSQNPEKLQQLNLFQPKLFTSVVKSGVKSQKQVVKKHVEAGVETGQDPLEDSQIHDSGVEVDTEHMETEQTDQSDQKTEDFVGKYATPASLTEFYIETKSTEKPLVILHLLHHLNYRNILCFTNSVESTHRLFLLIKLYGGVTVKEFSSNLHVARRNEILKKFADGKIDILICSDAMARGMDITSVKYVVSYDPPAYIQTYIHRIGRTARAGKEGTAFTLLQRKEFFHFKQMVRQAGKGKLKALKVFKNDLTPLLPKYKESLKKLGEIMKDEKLRKRHTPKKVQEERKTELKEDKTEPNEDST